MIFLKLLKIIFKPIYIFMWFIPYGVLYYKEQNNQTYSTDNI